MGTDDIHGNESNLSPPSQEKGRNFSASSREEGDEYLSETSEHDKSKTVCV